MSKVALITGVTGQDGSYLAELLLEKGYAVHGIKRRASSFNTERVDHIYQDAHETNPQFFLHYGDLTDSSNLIRIVKEVQPDEIYNLGAQSHVAVSFEVPEYTADVDALGTLRILEAIRFLGLEKKTKFYQASTSELFGEVQETPQKETTPFYPRSPYAVAKMYAYWIAVNYRESYGMYACNGILFNHESPRRGKTFVTRKITRAVANISQGLQSCLFLGNMDALREGVHLRAHGQKDPLVEYKTEAFSMFQELMENIKGEVLVNLFRSTTNLDAFHQFLQGLPMNQGGGDIPGTTTTLTSNSGSMIPSGDPDLEPRIKLPVTRAQPKVGRNEPCPCGSGKKFKQCCARSG